MAGARSLELPTSAISRCRLTVSDGHSRAPSETFGVVRNCQKLLTDPPHRPTEMLDFPRLASFSPIAWRPARRQATSHFLPITSRLHSCNRGVSHVGPEGWRVFGTENSGLSLTRKFRCRERSVKRFPDCCESQPPP